MRCKFSQTGVQKILNEYADRIANPESSYTQRIPYKFWTALRDANGVEVVENTSDNSISFFSCNTYDLLLTLDSNHEFYNFFYHNYLVYHKDYKPYTAASKNNSCLAYNGTANQKYGCMWTTTPNTWTNINDTWNVTLDNVSISDALKELADAAQTTSGAIGNIGNEIKKINDKNEKENDSMKGFNFDFGPCTGDNVRMSMYGIAVKNQAGEWVSYNPATAQIVNVDIFNFDGGKYMFKMPVSPSQVETGDVIIHNKKAMFVLEKDENGFVVVDPHAGEEKKVVPTSNCFGFNFITQVVSMFDAFAAAPTTDAPFGNFLPFMMMGEDKEIDPMMMMFMMNQNGANDMFSNPMMMYMLCGDKMQGDAVWPLMFLMNQNKGADTRHGK